MESTSVEKKNNDDQVEESERLQVSQKPHSSKFRERWLLTRKTLRYMKDAGKKLFPEGATADILSDDVPKAQDQFQKACSRSREYILWPHQDSDEPENNVEGSGAVTKKGKRRPANLESIPSDNYESSSSSLPCSPTQTESFHEFYTRGGRERHTSEGTYYLPPELYPHLKNYGSSALQWVASRLLEEQLMEEDEYEEEEGVEILVIDGKRMRSIGAQTDSQLDMCVQTDRDDTAEDTVQVGAETRAETEAAFALTQAKLREEQAAEMSETAEIDSNPDIQNSFSDNKKSLMKQKRPRLLQQQPTQQQPLFKKETPVLKKFWGRRESKTSEQIQQTITPVVDKSKGLASDKEAPPPIGGVAQKLKSIEAVSNVPGAVQKQPSSSPTGPKPPNQEIDKSPPKQTEKKSIKSVFKLGLKCDIEAQDGASKAQREKQNVDKFRTVNYDKMLRNIKSKYTKEEHEEMLMKIFAQEELNREAEILKDIPKKKKKSKAVQVGEALPAFILQALRVSSPIEIYYATKKKMKRRPSKAESADLSGSEGSASLASSMTTSPRYSISTAEDLCHRNLLGSEAEAYRLGLVAGMAGKRSSVDFIDSDHPPLNPMYQRSLSAQHAQSRYLNPQNISSIPRTQRASLLQYLLPAVMQRSRAGGSSSHSSSRLVAKRIWKTRSKSQSRASAATTSTWTPMGGNLWLSVTGLVVTLDSTSLLQLSEIERLTLQRLALAKLAALNLGCSVAIPKETSRSGGKKRRPYLLKRKALTTGFFDSKKDDKDQMTINASGGHVFGLTLNKCIENERQRQQKQAAELSAAVAATLEATGDDSDGRLSRKSSRGSRASFCSLADGAKQSSTGSLESLNLDRKRSSLVSGDLLGLSGGGGQSLPDLLHMETPLSQVPSLVSSCCSYLLSNGLHTLGIFRVSSSKKRVKQLRDEFDKGDEVILGEQCPHDVATLLKEFFRDLPEPLLSRDLYEAFLKTQKIRNRKLKFEATQHLIQLLPPTNRDTLYALLAFLFTVSEHAADSTNEKGETVSGNMMDTSNLATMFAPNILHMHQGGMDNISPAALAAMASERTDCISVVRSMIDNNKELFEISADLLDEVYHHLMDSHPEALDILLRRHAPPHDELENDLESGSSVFEGSECSSSLPRSPTDHFDFERLRSGVDEAMSQDKISKKEEDINKAVTRTRRRAEDSKSSSSTDAKDDKGWFRRRDKRSSSREHDGKISEERHAERSRWFRKREKPRASIDFGSKRRGSVAKSIEVKSDDKNASRDESLEADGRKRSSSDQTAAQERLRVPTDVTVRRLSSPEVDACGVITASLKIPVPHQAQLTNINTIECESRLYNNERVADDKVASKKQIIVSSTTSSNARQRTGSSDSFLGQPITGTMSFQPLCKKNLDKQSHDSVISTSSTDFHTLSPSARNTPLSEGFFQSGTSTPHSGATSPPLVLSPDSGTPGLSPSSSPLMTRKRSDGIQSLKYQGSRTTPSSQSTTHVSFGPKGTNPSCVATRIPKETRAGPASYSVSQTKGTTGIQITRSRTSDGITDVNIIGSSKKGNDVLNEASAGDRGSHKYTRRRYTRDGVSHTNPSAGNSNQSSTTQPQVWKRWEIIASDHGEPETFV